MNIYLASNYGRRAELQGYAAELRTTGHVVTSHWLDGSHDSLNDETPTDTERAAWAEEDLDDIHDSNILILFTGGELRRGGCMVEFGFALWHCHDVAVVGPRVNVFCCLPYVRQFDSWEQAKEWLAR